MKTTTKKDDRTRNWCFIVYPESAPENWEEILNNNHVKWAHSPVHDKDVNELDNETGEVEIKKAHYHVLFSFETLKSYKQVLEISKSVNGTIPQQCASVVGAVRYFVHLDNPEKYQYNRNDIKSFLGFDVVKPFEDTETINNQFNEIRAIIKEYKIQNLLVLLDKFDELGLNNLRDFIYQKGGFIVREMLNAQYQLNQIKKPKKEKLD